MKRSNDKGLRSNSKVKSKSNKAGSSKKKTVEVNEPKKPSLLDILKNDQDCNCEVVARAVRSNVHMNLGLADNRVKSSKDLDLKDI